MTGYQRLETWRELGLIKDSLIETSLLNTILNRPAVRL
jgi:hypothetical protein